MAQPPTRKRNFRPRVIAKKYRPLSVDHWFGKRSKNTSDKLHRHFRHHRERSDIRTRVQRLNVSPTIKEKCTAAFRPRRIAVLGATYYSAAAASP
jgi:hypothetical protein